MLWPQDHHDWAVRTLRRIARDLRSFKDGRIPNDAVDGFVLNLQIAYRELLVQEQLDWLYLEEAGGLIEAAMENLKQCKQCEGRTLHNLNSLLFTRVMSDSLGLIYPNAKSLPW